MRFFSCSFSQSFSSHIATANIGELGKTTTCAIRLTCCNDVQLINTNYAEHVVHKRRTHGDGSDRIGWNHREFGIAFPHLWPAIQRWKVVHLLLWIVRSMVRLVSRRTLRPDERPLLKLNFCFSFPLTVEQDGVLDCSSVLYDHPPNKSSGT